MSVTPVSVRPLRAIRTRFVLDRTTQAIVAEQSFPIKEQTAQLARRFFMWKHRSSQQREDCVERSWVEPLSNVTFILASSAKRKMASAFDKGRLWP